MSSPVLSFTTDAVPPHQRVKYWNQWSSSAITRSNIKPMSRDVFNGHVRILDTPAMRFANFISDAATLAHTRSHVAAETSHALILHLQLDGASYNAQDGRDTVIHRDDYTLCDSTRPYDLKFDRRNDMLSLRIPEAAFRERLGAPELLTCVHMSGRAGIGRLVSGFIRSCWQQYLEGIDPIVARKLADNILDVLATSYAVAYRSEVETSAVTTTRRLVVRRAIEDNLCNPDLSPAMLGTLLGYSATYLHKLFREGEETLCQYIMRRRLEEAARLLTDPLRLERSIGEVAFAVGFKNATHFGRVFRTHFGMTPTDYRDHALRATPLIKS